MVRRMLIDAAHPEETRVAVAEDDRLEEFDFESSTKAALKGNIFLGKVSRVEPSLQAAFVDFGQERHGFLSLHEIHPDYYQLPVDDREEFEQWVANAKPPAPHEGEEEETEELPSEEARIARLRTQFLHRYRIQEIIRRRQILLVQVVREERGNKGAALTTHLSLAGRYIVLMPNSERSSGISRKITNAQDRQRLREALGSLHVPSGMGVVARTAGVERSKTDIKKDYDYLVKVWEQIRAETLRSTAPSLVHEEANIIKRAIRDMYTRDMTEILVEGEEGYKTAKNFIKSLIPSHARRVQLFKREEHSLFQKYKLEEQIANIYETRVDLKSGGYLLINATEALIAIDVNSGRATRERNIEETAFRTNLEAAGEIARQLRIRDLAGLIVIDFIDMADPRNNAAVERRMKEVTKGDRARLQIGKISPFGLLELSRQRLGRSVSEASSFLCPCCGGTGIVRSTESTAIRVLRLLEKEISQEKKTKVTVSVAPPVAHYLLNHKRNALWALESKERLKIIIETDATIPPAQFKITTEAEDKTEEAESAPVETETLASSESDITAASTGSEESPSESEPTPPKKRGRRRRRRRSAPPQETHNLTEASPEQNSALFVAEPDGEAPLRARPQRARRSARPASTSAPVLPSSPELLASSSETEGKEAAPLRTRRQRSRRVNPTSARPSASSDISFPSLKEEGQELPKPEKAPASLGTVASSPIEGNFQEESILPPEKPRRKGWWHRLTR